MVKFISKTSLKAIMLFGGLNLICLSTLYAQEYGVELIPLGNFGTIESAGKNGDASGGKSLYPDTESAAGIYYQPVKKVWSGWGAGVLSNLDVNPGVTIGHAIDNRTTYKWGFNESWADGKFLLPKVSDGTNSFANVSHGPNNGYYVIATSTNGMYRPPLLGGNNWAGPLYDKYETNFQSPKNFFMVANADSDPKKIFYKEEVNVKPGRLYRLSVDAARLNTSGTIPAIAFIVSTSPNNLATIQAKTSKTLTSLTTWEDLHFDYIVPAGVTKVYVAFRNDVSGGFGNDLALDNLSMREIVARITAEDTATDPCTVGMTLRLENASFFANQRLGWQKKNASGTWVDIQRESSASYIATKEGDYRAIILIDDKGAFYSTNEIRVTKKASCLELFPLKANDDVFYTFTGVEITGNILINDELGSIGSGVETMSVVRYVVNGKSYSAGNSAPVYEGTTLLGAIKIGSNGDLAFTSVPDITVPKQIPPITYHIQSSYGTSDSAIISIRVTDRSEKPIQVTADASCIQCPVYVKLSGGGLKQSETYSLYKQNHLIGTFSKTSFDITFNETASGTFTYSVRNKNSDLVLTFSLDVHPASAEWIGNPTNGVWKEAANWKTSTGSGYPIWCTDVTIPSVSATYPLLVDGDAARDITFKDGASVGQVQKLNYRKAFIELNPARNRWYMLAAPLRYMYSADLHGDASWGNAISPKIFMMYFDITNNTNPDGKAGYSAGNFSRPFANLEEALSVGKSYILWVNGKANGLVYDDGNFPTGTPYKFPRLVNGHEPQYSYHNTKTGSWTTPVVGLDRGKVSSISTDEQWMASKGKLTDAQKDNQYRFLFEESISGTTLSIPVKGGVLNAIGNPFMSHIDFERFVLDNKDKVQGFYRIWDGMKFYLYVTDNSANTLWKGLGGLTTETTDAVTTQYIAPMQSFFVEVKSGVSSLNFRAENILGSNTQSKLRSTSVANNILKLELTMNGVSSRTFVVVREGASTGYNEDEDIKKLFSPNVSTPEIYTISDKESLELNMIGADSANQQVDLGIRTAQEGDLELKLSGTDDFDAYSHVLLRDNINGKIYDLKNTPSIKFSKTSKNDLEARFSILFSNGGSSLESTGLISSIAITDRSEVLNIESTNALLKSIELFDASGRLVESDNDINSSAYALSKHNYTKGVYVLRVISESEVRTLKVSF